MTSYSHLTNPYSSLAQFSVPTSASPSTVMSSVTGTGTGGSTACCETGRPVATDPVTGQVICSCQYESARLSLNSYAPRLGSGTALSYGTASYPSTEHNPYPSIGVDSAAYFSQFTNPYGLKDGGVGDMSLYAPIGGTPTYGYNPYEPSLYGYGNPYDLASRRKNATRESTSTLKAWLNEHKKNPYPTKGEKIMLAIITKMTLTQVSTWFANARRRLKKENKMTWEPRNKTESDDEDDTSDKEEKSSESETKEKDGSKDSCSTPMSSSSSAASPILEDKFSPVSADLEEKPRIWSLADTAAGGANSIMSGSPWSTAQFLPTNSRLQPHEEPAASVTRGHTQSRDDLLSKSASDIQAYSSKTSSASPSSFTPPLTPPQELIHRPSASSAALSGLSVGSVIPASYPSAASLESLQRWQDSRMWGCHWRPETSQLPSSLSHPSQTSLNCQQV